MIRPNGPPLTSLLGALFVAVATVSVFPTAVLGQTRTITGRVLDLESGEPVADATISIRESGRTDAISSALSRADGGFRVEVPVDETSLRIRVEHLAYGRFDRTLRAPGPGRVLLVEISRTAIQLAPLEVEVESRTERDIRTSGTQKNIITREQIETALGTAGTLATVLERFVTGVRVRNQQSSPGEPVCVEFRGARTLDNPNACHPPVIIMDGVRVSSPLQFFNWMPIEDVEQMEVVPPGEAGVQYGTDSNFGVLLIETKSGSSGREEEAAVSSRVRYDFEVEGVPYNWKRTFLSAFVGNAIGIGLGVLTARQCLGFDGLSDHFLDSECGSAATASARVALISFPLLGVGMGAGRAGRTDRSSGSFWHTVLGSALVGVPGYLIATAGSEDAWVGADWWGGTLVLFGVPAVATLTDRLFRSERGPALAEPPGPTTELPRR